MTGHDEQFLAFIVQVLLPLVVGLVTKKSWNKHAKTALLAVLTGLNTLLLGLQTGGDIKELGFSAAIGLAVSLATHYGIYKPTGASTLLQESVVKDVPPEVHFEPEEVVVSESQDEITDAELEELAQTEE